MVHTCIRALRICTLHYCAIVLLPHCPIHYVLLLHIMVHHEQNKKKAPLVNMDTPKSMRAPKS